MAYNKQPIISPAELEAWLNRIDPDTGRRYTQRKIAQILGCTPANITYIKKSAGNFRKTAREAAMENFPWDTPERFHGAPLNRRIRDHLEYMATGGRGMSDEKLRYLRWFYDKIEREDLVVEYDPNIPPSEGATKGGFALRRRKKSDGDLIIRVNKYTRLTDLGRALLRMPPRKPNLRSS